MMLQILNNKLTVRQELKWIEIDYLI
jgi:hypothetical protein